MKLSDQSRPRKRTTDLRRLARKDKTDLYEVELQTKIASIFRKYSFDVVRAPKHRHNVFAVGTHMGQPYRVEIAAFRIVAMAQFEAIVKRTREFLPTLAAGSANELWLVGEYLSDDVMHMRDETHPRVKVLRLDELEKAVRKISKKTQPAYEQKRPSRIRTKVAKTIVANAAELRTAVTTSIVLIEERLEVLHNSRPNSKDSIESRNDEIHRLSVIRTQLEALRNYPELLRTGQLKESVAVDAVKSLSQGIGEYWSKHTNAICDKMLTFGLFSSLIVVAQLSGVTPEIAFGLAGSMTYGKPVIDALKAMKGWFKSGK